MKRVLSPVETSLGIGQSALVGPIAREAIARIIRDLIFPKGYVYHSGLSEAKTTLCETGHCLLLYLEVEDIGHLSAHRIVT